MSSIPKIDVHHHVIPPEIAGSGEGMKGMQPPRWTLSSDNTFSKNNNIRTRILSVSTPGVSHIADPGASAAAARSMNEYSAKLRDADPTSIGFFATVPSLEHMDLALRELRYALDELHADGVTLFTRYGNNTDKDGYLGHPDYVPLWEELNIRKAVVFVHPCNGRNGSFFNDLLPGPCFDWPHETGRTAMDLILHNRLEQHTDVKIVLSHAGGTLPLLARRSTLISTPEFGAAMSSEDIIGQAKRFYFDLALSGCEEILPLVLEFAERGHLLFGSDFPHATVGFAERNIGFINGYGMKEELRKELYYEAAIKLFPRLKEAYQS